MTSPKKRPSRSNVVELQELLQLVSTTHQFQRIERGYLVAGTERWENDAEHSYQLALVAWYLIIANTLSLNLTLVLQYALAHDLVEIHAGDTFIYGRQEHLQSKQEREEQAAKQLQDTFPEFTDLHLRIKEYEERVTPESKFVYALDKLLPVLNIYLDDGKSWQKAGVTITQLLHSKDTPITLSPDVLPYYVELRAILVDKQQTLFPEP